MIFFPLEEYLKTNILYLEFQILSWGDRKSSAG